jgi:hypothetical protein
VSGFLFFVAFIIVLLSSKATPLGMMKKRVVQAELS